MFTLFNLCITNGIAEIWQKHKGHSNTIIFFNENKQIEFGSPFTRGDIESFNNFNFVYGVDENAKDNVYNLNRPKDVLGGKIDLSVAFRNEVNKVDPSMDRDIFNGQGIDGHNLKKFETETLAALKMFSDGNKKLFLSLATNPSQTNLYDAFKENAKPMTMPDAFAGLSEDKGIGFFTWSNGSTIYKSEIIGFTKENNTIVFKGVFSERILITVIFVLFFVCSTMAIILSMYFWNKRTRRIEEKFYGGIDEKDSDEVEKKSKKKQRKKIN